MAYCANYKNINGKKIEITHAELREYRLRKMTECSYFYMNQFPTKTMKKLYRDFLEANKIQVKKIYADWILIEWKMHIQGVVPL